MSDSIASSIDKRLDKFEQKLDKLAEAVLAIARIEERQAQTSRSIERLFTKQEEYDKQFAIINQSLQTNKTKVTIGERLGWIIVTGLISLLTYFFK